MESGCFNEGDEVEVTSKQVGLDKSWYAATIVRPARNRKSFQVEYETLITQDEEAGSSSLKEFVSVSNIRPRPKPSLLHVNDVFKLNEEIDAFYNDGWWEGVIIKVVVGIEGLLTYTVYFPNTKEVMEFGQSEMRKHVDWINGVWLRSRDVGNSQPVEVKFDDENCLDAWFPAILVSQARNNSFSVEYTNLKYRDKQLKTIVPSHHLRPSPPQSSVHKEFQLLEKVEAYYDFAWWSGVISGVLVANRYMVLFEPQNKEKMFKQFELRLRMEWTAGKWLQLFGVPFLSTLLFANYYIPETSATPHIQSGTGSSPPTGSTALSIEMATPLILSNKATSPKKRTIEVVNPKSCSNIIQYYKRAKKGQATKASNLIQACDTTHSTSEKAQKEKHSAVESEVQRKKMPSVVHDFPEKMGGIENKKQREGRMDKHAMDLIKRKRGRPRKGCLRTKAALTDKGNEKSGQENLKTLDSSIKLLTDGREHEDASTREIIVRTECAELPSDTEGDLVPLAGLLVNMNSSSTVYTSGLSWLMLDNAITKSRARESFEYQKQLAVGETSSTMDKQIILYEHNNATGDELNESGAYQGMYSQIKVLNTRGMTDIVVPVDCAEQLSHTAEEYVTPSVSLEKSSFLPVRDNRGGSPGNGLMFNEAITKEDRTECLGHQRPLAVAASSYSFDAQRISNDASGDTQSETTVQPMLVYSTETTCSTPQQGNEVSEQQISEDASFPFIKSSPLWGDFNAMDAFQIPQQPHFCLLGQCNEELREGIAIGHMLGFATLVDRMRATQLDGAQKALENKLIALIELEKHGFNVQPLRNRLERMLIVKDKHRQLVDDSEAIYKQLVEGRNKKDGLEAEIRELQETISGLNKKLQLVASEKEKKGSIVADLEREADEIRERIQGVRLEFDILRAALWRPHAVSVPATQDELNDLGDHIIHQDPFAEIFEGPRIEDLLQMETGTG